MQKILVALLVLFSGIAVAGSRYVDATWGKDTNAGTLAAPYKTFAVAFAGLAAGDTVYLKRGEIWYEKLTLTGSGTSSSPITIDAYGTGEPPTIDGTRKLLDADWSADSTVNIWSATVVSVAAGHQMTLSLDNVGGVPKSDKASLALPGDYYVTGTTLYLFANVKPSLVWADIRVWERDCISVSSYNYITIRHVRCQRYRLYGVVANTTNTGIKVEYSEFWFGNPMRTQDGGTGIRTNGGDIVIRNVTLSAPGLYGIRSLGTTIVTNTIVVGASQSGISLYSGTLTYDHCAVVGNGGGPWDLDKETEGSPTDGGGNVTFGLGDVLPFANPGLITMMYDDGDDSYWSNIYPVFDEFEKRSCPGFGTCPFGIAMMAGRSSTSNYQSRAAKHDLISHNWSHIYAVLDFDGVDDPGIIVRYVGAGSGATMTITANGVPRKLTTTVSGGPGGENLSLNLHAAAYDTISELCTYLNGLTGVYTCSLTTGANATCHSTGLTATAGADIKTAPVTVYLNQDRTVRDELKSAVVWLRSLYNDPSREIVMAWPGGDRNTTIDTWPKDEGVTACLDTLQSGEVFWGDWPNGCLPRYSIKRFHGLSSFLPIAQRAVMYSATNGGRPIILFEHPLPNGWMTPVEMGQFLDAILAAGGHYSTPSAIALDWAKSKKRPVPYTKIYPSATSVLINGGAIWSGIPASDANGNPIIGLPDIGAYERQPWSVQ